MAAPPDNLSLILWHDVFVLIDHGQAGPADYDTLGQRVLAETRRFPRGVGALIIIPSDASPPRDDARLAMNQLMQQLGKSLRCLCWLVEGTGFQGAMVRAVLTGLKTFGRFAYPCHVSSNLTEGVGWILHALDGGDGRARDVDDGVREISAQRRGAPPELELVPSSRRARSTREP